METKTNKPQHTQGELEIVEVTDKIRQDLELSASDCFILRSKSAPHMHIATIHNWNPKGDAQRIFKAVNMHDELVLQLERLLTESARLYGKQKKSSDCITFLDIPWVVETKKLLKKAQDPE